MKRKLLLFIATGALFMVPKANFSQVITLGSTASYVVFTADGPVTNTGISQYTGNVGTNNGSNTGFGNVNGVMHSNDASTVQAKTDLLSVYSQLNNTTVTNTLTSSLLGNGQALFAGVYAVNAAATLNGGLTLDAQGISGAVFIIKIHGSFSTGASAKVYLINGAVACNVYWQVEGLVSMASGTTLRGTIVANNAAINMNTGDTLEGRAFSTIGAITGDGILAYTPIGCGSPVLTGPTAPNMGAAGCYAIFSANGAVTNTGVSHVVGDVGSNQGSATGFNPSFVTGTVHSLPDGSTSQCAADLLSAYTYLNNLVPDIELLYPAQFGNNLVLTPHTYLLNGAATFTDSLYLNAEGNANAVFVIQIQGALSTSTYSRVKLINGAKANNVYWKVEGAVTINNYSIFNGNIIANNGAVGAINTGVVLYGRILTTTGALTTDAVMATASVLPSNCGTVGIQQPEGTTQEALTIYPNPFHSSVNLVLNDASDLNHCELKLYNVLGAEVMNISITSLNSTIETANLPSGIYFYKVIGNNHTIQSGRLISQ